MITITDESITPPAGEEHWQSAGSTAPGTDEADIAAGGAAIGDRAANALTIDQGLPRLLYELAVRLPVQPNIQALCVWLYEPAGKATRLHVLMADLPVKLRNGMGFPVEDSIAGWVWQKQQPLIIDAKAETRFPEFARDLLEAGIKSFCGVPLMIANRRIGVWDSPAPNQTRFVTSSSSSCSALRMPQASPAAFLTLKARPAMIARTTKKHSTWRSKSGPRINLRTLSVEAPRYGLCSIRSESWLRPIPRFSSWVKPGRARNSSPAPSIIAVRAAAVRS